MMSTASERVSFGLDAADGCAARRIGCAARIRNRRRRLWLPESDSIESVGAPAGGCRGAVCLASVARVWAAPAECADIGRHRRLRNKRSGGGEGRR